MFLNISHMKVGVFVRMDQEYLFNKVREIHVWSVSSLNTTTGNNEKVVKKNVSEKDSRNNKSSDVNRDTDANILMSEFCINREESRECMHFRCNCTEFVSWRALHGSSINLFHTTCIKCWRIMNSIYLTSYSPHYTETCFTYIVDEPFCRKIDIVLTHEILPLIHFTVLIRKQGIFSMI
ncbi:hypothetical protein RhiirC2_258979 [Rhizophagus irregularis]|uniref:Uncharacterized protein n=1 Tax=Rhizophagus irregularis TaxID=588596 RepID=A0A2N1NME2_9GLOM|nr:hypothetical protein RhiirC2_258979 [Rhizophagus irregularis]